MLGTEAQSVTDPSSSSSSSALVNSPIPQLRSIRHLVQVQEGVGGGWISCSTFRSSRRSSRPIHALKPNEFSIAVVIHIQAVFGSEPETSALKGFNARCVIISEIIIPGLWRGFLITTIATRRQQLVNTTSSMQQRRPPPQVTFASASGSEKRCVPWTLVGM